MRKILYVVVSIMMVVLWACKPSSGTDTQSQPKTLILYFSWSSSHNTKQIAEFIHDFTGGDIAEIVSAEELPTEMDSCIRLAQEQLARRIFPAVKPLDINPLDYDRIFVGYPNWCGSVPMVVASCMRNYDWNGKTVIPFITHGTGGRQNCFTDLALHVHGADILDGFSCYGSNAAEEKSNVEKWLRQISD